jgi:peptidoglycan/LPS O-acetylase OafA/YrhL
LVGNKTYFNNLDALRFFAAFGVITSHIADWFKFPSNTIGRYTRIIISLDGESGNAGVSFFFVLSGFLITYLLFEEEKKYNGIKVLNFYVRRILRIWPLYFLTLFIGFVIYPKLSMENFHETASWPMYAMFLANFDNIFQLPRCGILGVQWSIAVEEQFYILWPLLFLLFSDRKKFAIMCFLLIACSTFFHAIGFHKFHTLSALTDLAMGGLMAHLAFYHHQRVIFFFQGFTRLYLILIYSTGFLLILFHFQITKHFPFYQYADRFLMALFFSFIILEQNYCPVSFFKFGSIPF